MYNISDNSEGICFYLKYIHILLPMWQVCSTVHERLDPRS